MCDQHLLIRLYNNILVCDLQYILILCASFDWILILYLMGVSNIENINCIVYEYWLMIILSILHGQFCCVRRVYWVFIWLFWWLNCIQLPFTKEQPLYFFLSNYETAYEQQLCIKCQKQKKIVLGKVKCDRMKYVK